MNLKETLATLQKAGTAQNRKIYLRHGAAEPIIGVSYGELGKLQRKIKEDTALALELWDTAQHDARILACKVAVPAELGSRQLRRWASEAKDNDVLLGELATLVAKSPEMKELSDSWATQKAPSARALAWETRSSRALGEEEETLPETECASWLDTIANSLQDEDNNVRHSMNNALIAIGVRTPALTKKALEVAAQIGKVEVDHGETGCKTPDAAPYIEKTLAQRAKKGARYSRGTGRA